MKIRSNKKICTHKQDFLDQFLPKRYSDPVVTAFLEYYNEESKTWEHLPQAPEEDWIRIDL